MLEGDDTTTTRLRRRRQPVGVQLNLKYPHPADQEVIARARQRAAKLDVTLASFVLTAVAQYLGDG